MGSNFSIGHGHIFQAEISWVGIEIIIWVSNYIHIKHGTELLNHALTLTAVLLLKLGPGVKQLHPTENNLGLYLLSDKTSYRKISWSLEDSSLGFSNRSEIWQAPRQQRCRDACQISEGYDRYKIQSRSFETSRDLAVRRLTA